MDIPTATSTVVAIATVICMFFAAPIVSGVAPVLAVVLIVLGVFYSLGVVAQLFMSYRTPVDSDE